MGGIVAQYPTRVAFPYPSRYLPQGRDRFGEVLKEAHADRSGASAGVGLDQALSITHEGAYWRFTLPTLKAYEVVVLE